MGVSGGESSDRLRRKRRRRGLVPLCDDVVNRNTLSSHRDRSSRGFHFGHASCSAKGVRTDTSHASACQLRAVVCPVCEEWAVADVGGRDPKSRAWMEEPVANAVERIVAVSMNPAPDLLRALLLTEQCSAVAIVDREHRPVDVVTRYDLLESIVTSRRDSLDSPRCTLLLESTPIELAVRRLLETDSQHLIVVDEGRRFVGLVTPGSLLARARAWGVTDRASNSASPGER